jgi:protein-L-isoaspartate(D-aspartate) O-methyltransferase
MNTPSLSQIERARFNMIEQQIRPWDVGDEALLEAIANVPREQFVPTEYQNLAFSDLEIPLIVHGEDTNQVMLAPKIQARLAQALELKPDDCVLEIGTGSGYQTAVLAALSRQVTSIELDSRLAAFAQENLDAMGVDNVTVEHGDGSEGWGTTEYDAILVSGAVPSVPDALKYQLRIGGRLVVVAGQSPVMSAMRITRMTAASFETESLFETVIKPLIGPRVSRFKF